MIEYKYYLDRDSLGNPHEIYRGSIVEPEDFPALGLWRAKKNGSWSDDEEETRPLINLWLKGDFDPEDDEITEATAMAYLQEWRSGVWPGRD